MMEIFSVAFSGHREISRFNEVETKLLEIITSLLRTKNYVSFLVGNNGDFDAIATSVIRSVRKRMGSENSSVTLILPYNISNLDLLEKSDL